VDGPEIHVTRVGTAARERGCWKRPGTQALSVKTTHLSFLHAHCGRQGPKPATVPQISTDNPLPFLSESIGLQVYQGLRPDTSLWGPGRDLPKEGYHRRGGEGVRTPPFPTCTDGLGSKRWGPCGAFCPSAALRAGLSVILIWHVSIPGAPCRAVGVFFFIRPRIHAQTYNALLSFASLQSCPAKSRCSTSIGLKNFFSPLRAGIRGTADHPTVEVGGPDPTPPPPLRLISGPMAFLREEGTLWAGGGGDGGGGCLPACLPA
jgi:hypothetical protein